jgi:hypothetical protein
MNLAYIILRPQVDFAMVMATNISGPVADEALRALAAELYQDCPEIGAHPSGQPEEQA